MPEESTLARELRELKERVAELESWKDATTAEIKKLRKPEAPEPKRKSGDWYDD